jgi:2-oxoglutarate ferredoxin oxidoreductase subunit gamma
LVITADIGHFLRIARKVFDMLERMVIAGFGGQGILTAGKLLAAAAMSEGRHVTYFPSYGTEVRGGTANCQVVVSDDEIASPLVEEATSLLIMNAASMMRFLPTLVEGGLMVLNVSMVKAPALDRGRQVLEVPATGIAQKIGSVQVANAVMLAALNEARGIVDPDRLLQTFCRGLRGRKDEFIPLNEKAFEAGRGLAAAWLRAHRVK